MNTLFTLPRNSLQPELLPFPRGSIFFAPMESITDEPYRLAILKTYPEWDFVCTDFLRISGSSLYPPKHMVDHLGESTYQNPEFRKKTIYQVLTSPGAHTIESVKRLSDIGITWLDLNLGCPSKTVNSSKGGAYLLSDLTALQEIIQSIRFTFSGLFTVKMRVGYRNDTQYVETLKLLEGEGVQAITVHARTRDELYKGRANWNYIKTAVQTCHIPIVGNGDIWTIQDINEVFQHTGCHSIMLARGALKTPWMAKILKDPSLLTMGNKELLDLRKQEIHVYFQALEREYEAGSYPASAILKRFKALSRYLFEDLPAGDSLKSRLLRSPTLRDFKEILTREL